MARLSLNVWHTKLFKDGRKLLKHAEIEKNIGEKFMKKLLVLLSVFWSLCSFAQDCVYSSSYENTGWIIHDPQSFEQHAKNVKNLIKKGLDDGSVIFDISGPILADQTIDGQELLLDAMMFDNLKTDRDDMYGDFAILEVVNELRDLVEVRWYDGMKRNIVVNPKFLRCFSEGAPYVDNSVL